MLTGSSSSVVRPTVSASVSRTVSVCDVLVLSRVVVTVSISCCTTASIRYDTIRYDDLLVIITARCLHKLDLCRRAVSVCLSACLSVRLSVTLAYILSKQINISSKLFSPSGSHIILAFQHRTLCQYSDGNPPPPHNGGVEYRWGRQKLRFSTNI